MYWLLWGILISYVIVGTGAFVFFYKFRKLIGYHLGMNLAMTSSGVIGLAGGILLFYLFPDHFTSITILTTLIAVAVGILFGALVDYQTIITGVTSGIMGGLMGPMIGAMADQPIVFILFCSLLVYLSFGLLCYSVRS